MTASRVCRSTMPGRPAFRQVSRVLRQQYFFETERRRLADLALPYPDDLPAPSPESAEVPHIPADVALELPLPVLGKLQPPRREAPAVPEISVDADRDPEVAQHAVATPRQVFAVLLPPQSGPSHEFRHRALGLGALPPYPRHHCAAGRNAHDVPPVEPYRQ